MQMWHKSAESPAGSLRGSLNPETIELQESPPRERLSVIRDRQDLDLFKYEDVLLSGPSSSRLIILPNSQFRKAWTLLISVALLYTLVLMPFFLAFAELLVCESR